MYVRIFKPPDAKATVTIWRYSNYINKRLNAYTRDIHVLYNLRKRATTS